MICFTATVIRPTIAGNNYNKSVCLVASYLISLRFHFKVDDCSADTMKTTHCTHFDNKTTLPICQFLARSNSAIDDRKTSRSRSRSRFFSAIDDLDLDRTTAIDRSRSISIARRSRHLCLGNMAAVGLEPTPWCGSI